MENVKETTVDALTDILKLHNDRIQGYEMAINDTDDVDLKALFSKYAEQSRTMVSELTTSIERAGGEVPDSTTFLGQLHKAWMELKSSMTTNDRHSILNSVEQGEDAILEAYQEAVKDDNVVLMSVRTTLLQQQEQILQAHNHIRALRDMAEVAA
jgi:uncharacterized protein (TIGR02284 family)